MLRSSRPASAGFPARLRIFTAGAPSVLCRLLLFMVPAVITAAWFINKDALVGIVGRRVVAVFTLPIITGYSAAGVILTRQSLSCWNLYGLLPCACSFT